MNLADYRLCASPSTYAGNPPTPVSAYLSGYSDARKLGGAIPIGFPSLALAQSEGAAEGLQEATPTFHGHIFTCALITLQLDDGGLRQLPPLRATLLGFGFEPVTATAIVTQLGTAPLTTVLYIDTGPASLSTFTVPATVVAVARLELRLTNVRVNGVPFDVGPSCHSAGPLFTPGNPVAPGEVMLVGGTYPGDPVPSFGGAFEGGALAGEADIPPLTGCVTPSGENLDPLLTASLSGPGNFLREVVGAVCLPAFAAQCVSGDLPASVPLWTVSRGGTYTSSGKLTFTVQTPVSPDATLTITCRRSQIAGLFPDVTGPSRGGLATVGWQPMTGCRGSDGSTWSVTQQGVSYFGPHTLAAGVATGNVDHMLFSLTGTGTGAPGACQALMEGYESTTYSNAGSVLSLLGDTTTVLVTQSTCPDLPRVLTEAPGAGSADVAATYPLLPGGYHVTSP